MTNASSSAPSITNRDKSPGRAALVAETAPDGSHPGMMLMIAMLVALTAIIAYVVYLAGQMSV